MLRLAVEFINETHGGDAVFAARLDRDEVGRHAVDVFFTPRYVKQTKQHGAEIWISTSRHGKTLCEKHRKEIERRHWGKFLTGPRQVGIAMQAELYVFLRKRRLVLQDRSEKQTSTPDRAEPNSELGSLRSEVSQLREESQRLRAENAELLKGFELMAQEVQPFIDQLPPSVRKAVEILVGDQPQRPTPPMS